MIFQKQIRHLRYADLAALTASSITANDVAYIVSENAWYTRVGGVNTKVNPSISTAGGITNVPAGNIAATNVQTAINELDTEKQSLSEKGLANGYASLDATGKVPATQLPSYVDDVLEFANLVAFPATGETGKLYTALDSNKLYRWSGSTYVEVSAFSGIANNVAVTPTGNIAATDVQAALVELDTEKQADLQFQEEGTNVGTSGGISIVNFTGIGTATVTGSTLTYNVPTVTATTVTNAPAGTIAATTVQAAINELDVEKQGDITIQDEGVTQGVAGQALTYNFVGTGVTAAVAGSVATITVAGKSTDNFYQIIPTATNTIPNLVPAPIDGSKVQLSVNGLIERTISVSNAGVVTVSASSLGYNIETTDTIEVQYLSL